MKTKTKGISHLLIIYILIFNRLTPVNLSPKMDPRREETLAGRRFLKVLRESHKVEDESTDPKVQTVKTASFNFGVSPKKDDVNDLKRKRMTLRTTLEELLVEYLRGLAPDGEDPAEKQSRVKRNENSVQHQDFSQYDENRNENSDAENVNNSNVRAENRIRSNNYSVENTNEHIELEDGGNATVSNSSKNVCAERRQRITQLDRNELNAAIQNVSEHEHNIRRLLNYRYFNVIW